MLKRIQEFISRNKALVIVLSTAGIFLRLYFYFLNRSLWIDEARLALNLVNRSFLGLFQPLDYDQGAPIGFLLMEKLVITIFGSSEFILRLVPLVAGLVSVPLMYWVAKRYLKGWAPSIALLLFALSGMLIYYSSELKQYSSDVLISLLLLFSFPLVKDKPPTPRSILVLGGLGIIGLWVSHPSIFIWLSMVLALCLDVVRRKERRSALWLIGMLLVSGLNLLCLYLVSLRALTLNDYLEAYWSGGFAPFPPWLDFRWFGEAASHMLVNPGGFQPTLIIVVLLVAGMFSFAIRNWRLLIVLLFPYFLLLMASSAHIYPFKERMILFSLPLLFMLLAEGVERIRSSLLAMKLPGTTIFTILIVGTVITNPILTIIGNIKTPARGEAIKPVITYLRKEFQKGDCLYVYYGAQPAFEFYTDPAEFNVGCMLLGENERGTPELYFSELRRLSGEQRVWILFSHVFATADSNEEELILGYLNAIGQNRDRYLSNGASIYLYDLSGK